MFLSHKRHRMLYGKIVGRRKSIRDRTVKGEEINGFSYTCQIEALDRRTE